VKAIQCDFRPYNVTVLNCAYITPLVMYAGVDTRQSALIHRNPPKHRQWVVADRYRDRTELF
jgi:hypothetical protein